MVLIRVGEPPTYAPTKRLRLDAVETYVLASDGGVSLPADVRVELNPAAAALAGLDVEDLLDAARGRLVAAGVLRDGGDGRDGDGGGDGGAVAPVVANLAALTGSPRRLRTSYGAPGSSLTGHHWVDLAGAGSLVLTAGGCELSVFDPRRLGDEVLRLPPPGAEATRGRQPSRWRLDDLATAGLVAEDLADRPPEMVAAAMGLADGSWRRLRSLVDGLRGVLHVRVSHPEGGAPRDLVWFDTDEGWWACRPETVEGEPAVTLLPRDRAELLADLAFVTTAVWA